MALSLQPVAALLGVLQGLGDGSELGGQGALLLHSLLELQVGGGDKSRLQVNTDSRIQGSGVSVHASVYSLFITQRTV